MKLKSHLKRRIAIFLIFCLMVGLCPPGMSLSVNVCAAETNGVAAGDNIVATLSADGTLEFTGSGEMYNYEFNTSPWYNDTSIKKVIINEGITTLGDFTFSGCSSLKQVVFPEEFSAIGTRAFFNTGLTKVKIPDGVKSIPSHAFYGCTGLSQVELPESLTHIGMAAFWNCRSLATIEIPKNVSEIANTSFYGCTALTEIVLPKAIKNVVVEAFMGCTNLKKATIYSDDAFLQTNIFRDCASDFTICAHEGSSAEEYAEEYGYQFEVLSPESTYDISNPRITEGITTWDCIWFGNYWQEDTNGDGRADKNDAKTPIKWRVLSVNGDDAFLLADKSLDCQKYNDTWTDVTWETCTMRSWLNGYGASGNVCGTDYTSGNFLDYAFTAGEQSAIKTTNVVNEDNPDDDTEGGNNTSDQVYLLSIGEVTNPDYGFTASTTSTETRTAVNTAYVAAGGEIKSPYKGEAGDTANWWLRSPGHRRYDASYVYDTGYVYADGNYVDYFNYAARPALHLNLSFTSSWSYAGTVTSDGEVDEEATPVPGEDERDDTSIDKSQISISVDDYDTFGQAVSDAHVSIEDIGEGITDEKGKVRIENTLSEPSGMKKIQITKEGYRDYVVYTTIVAPDLVSIFCTNEIRASLKKKNGTDDVNPYLCSFVYYSNEVAKSAYGQAFTADDMITFRACGVWNDKQPGYYCLYQKGGKSFESKDGIFKLKMKDSFQEKGDICIKMVAADGTESEIKDTGIRLSGLGFSGGDISEDSGIPLLNATAESGVLTDVPFLNSDKLSFDLGKFKTVIKRDGNKVRIMLGADKSSPSLLQDDSWENWKKFCESQPKDLSLSQWKNVVEGGMEASWTTSVKMKITGYGWLEGELGSDEPLRGGIQVVLDGGVGFKQQYMVGVIPVYMEENLGVKGKFEGNVTYDMSNNRLGGNNEITVEPYLSVGGGLGVLYVAQVGAEGTASMPTKFSIPKGLISSNLVGSLSLKASVLGFSYSKEMAKMTYLLYPGTTINSKKDKVQQKLKGIATSPDEMKLYSMDAYSLPEDTVKTGTWEGERVSNARTNESKFNEQLLQTCVSKLTQPKLIQNVDTTMAFFLTEDAERSTIQRTKLVYTQYDNATGTWSEPKAVWEDATADYLPSIGVTNDQIVVSWLNFSNDCTDDSTMADALASSKLCAAVWNEAEERFDISDKVLSSSENASYNSSKAVTDADGNVTMVGLKNSENDI
ncbi:MAG: leucine-rich repeat protein, partial [Eubacterium sp.]